jgi:hypothetical protein
MARIEASGDANDQHFWLNPDGQRVVMYGELSLSRRAATETAFAQAAEAVDPLTRSG